jgi:fatty acid desaturase
MTRPILAAPTLMLFGAAALAFAWATTTAVLGPLIPWAAVVVNTAAIVVMFHVAHEAVHRLVSRSPLVNETVGRIAIGTVSPTFSLPVFRFLHLTHHRRVNEPDDPDLRVSHAHGWRLPLVWLTADASYVDYYWRRWRDRPRRELVETVALNVASLVLFAAVVAFGGLWQLVLLYFLPQRIALVLLGWWFDWLPHHGLEPGNRYRATRVRLGMEWLLTPVLVAQNYHLVHHLNPTIPFYRYGAEWRRNRDFYLRNDVAISSAFGRD